jgi:hypothetical protein
MATVLEKNGSFIEFADREDKIKILIFLELEVSHI